jgi:hypothetical protein
MAFQEHTRLKARDSRNIAPSRLSDPMMKKKLDFCTINEMIKEKQYAGMQFLAADISWIDSCDVLWVCPRI